MNKTTLFLASALLTWSSLAATAADKLGIGDEVPAFKLEDATERKLELGDDVRRIYATASRDADGYMEEVLKKNGQAQLDAQKAVVIADISAAPFFIKGFIRSDLEDRSYVTWLDESGDTSKVFPHRPDRVLVIDLDKRRITAVRHAKNIKEMKQELAAVLPPETTPDADASEAAPVEAPGPADDSEAVEPADESQEPANADL